MRLAAGMIKGRLTADIILRSTSTGKSVCNFDVAINTMQGNTQVTTYAKFVAWEKLANKMSRYGKGDMVWVESEIGDSKSYTNRDGNVVTYIELVVTDVIGDKTRSNGSTSNTSSSVTNTPAPAAPAGDFTNTSNNVVEAWD